MYERRELLQSRLMGNTSLEMYTFRKYFYTKSLSPCQEAILQSIGITMKR